MDKREIIAYAVAFDLAECHYRYVSGFNQLCDVLGWSKARRYITERLEELYREIEQVSVDIMLSDMKQRNSPKNSIDK